MTRSFLCRGLAFVCAASAALDVCADTIVANAREQQGVFAGYEDGDFLFQAAGEARARRPRTSVRKLLLDKPAEVVLAQGAATQVVRLVGYERSRFIVEADGARSEISGLLVRSIAVRSAANAETRAGNEGTGPRRALDLSGIDEKSLAVPQADALARYRAAWRKYSEFLDRSSAMVAEMDRARGARREALLNALRARKNEEQPLLNELSAAEETLRRAIPPGAAARSTPEPAPDGPAPAASPPAAPPKAPEGEIVVIDTSALEAAPQLTPPQREAIAQYKSAASRLTALAAAPDIAASDLAAARQQLHQKQDALLAAFPTITFR